MKLSEAQAHGLISIKCQYHGAITVYLTGSLTRKEEVVSIPLQQSTMALLIVRLIKK